MKPISEVGGVALRDCDVVIEVDGDQDQYAYLAADGEVPHFKRVRIDRNAFLYWRETGKGEFVRLPPDVSTVEKS
jgi:hypothetical protein